MQPITQNITFVRGDTLQFDVHLTDVEATVERGLYITHNWSKN